MNVLEARGLSMDFGGLRAVDRLDSAIEHGEIIALIGPNGAGKTTFFNCVTGMYPPTEGTVTINAPGRQPEVVTGMKPDKIAARGLARTFQNIRLFPDMTVLENVMVRRHCRRHAGRLGPIFRNRNNRAVTDGVGHVSNEIP